MTERKQLEAPSKQLSGEQQRMIWYFEQIFHNAVQDPRTENINELLKWVDVILFFNVGVEALRLMESLRSRKNNTVNGRAGTISYQKKSDDGIEKQTVETLRLTVLEAMADPTTSPLSAAV